MYRVIITVNSENAANTLKRGIEEAFPLVEGNITIHKEPEITTLDKLIEAERNK